jgi:hypothetical protein
MDSGMGGWGGGREPANGVLRDAVHKIYHGVLYIQNGI